MARELAEPQVATLLVVLAVATLAGLLPIPWADTAVALLLVAAGLAVLLSLRSRGNRLLAAGLVALGGVLLLAGWLDGFAFGARLLTVLVAAILLAAAWLKRQGKW